MILSEKQIRVFVWLRGIMLGLMALGGIVSGSQPDFLPAIVPKISGFVAGLAGGVATWAASMLPGSGDKK